MAIQQTRRALEPTREQDPREEEGLQRQSRQRGLQQKQPRPGGGSTEQIANGLGWFSIGLGLAEILVPKSFAKFIGAEGKHTAWIRLQGIREITAGIGILSNPMPAQWVWARVAGDVMDLASLGVAFASPKSNHTRLALSTAAVIGVTALDVLDAKKLSANAPEINRAAHAITINRKPEEVYSFYRDFQNLPRFMAHLESVTVTDERRSHWVAKGPAGTTVEWDAEITEDRPNQLIAWRSIEGADVDNSGTITFAPAPAGRGTEIRVELEYNPPGGLFGAAFATLFGEEPDQQLKGDLYRFKQVMETGEVMHSDSSIHRGPHPAQPKKSE